MKLEFTIHEKAKNLSFLFCHLLGSVLITQRTDFKINKVFDRNPELHLSYNKSSYLHDDACAVPSIILQRKIQANVESFTLCTGQIEASTSPRAYPGHLTVILARGGGRGIVRCLERVGNLNQIYLLF